jgi:hypothetical protein
LPSRPPEKYFDQSSPSLPRPPFPPRHFTSSTRHSEPSRPSSSKAAVARCRHRHLPSVLLVLILHPLAQARVEHLVTLVAYRLHPLTTMIESKAFCMRCACSTNLTTKTACSPQSVQSLPSLPNDCSYAAYVWKRCPMIQSLVLIVVDIPSAANACTVMSPRASTNIDSPYYVPVVLRIKATERGQPAVRVVSGGSFHLLSSYIMFPLEVSQVLALDLGLTDEQYSIWTQMEMVSVSILLNCRKYVSSVHLPLFC